MLKVSRTVCVSPTPLLIFLYLVVTTDLVRIQNALFLEQEEIRDDIERVANEIEMLDSSIRLHISRNTACLDTVAISKK